MLDSPCKNFEYSIVTREVRNLFRAIGYEAIEGESHTTMVGFTPNRCLIGPRKFEPTEGRTLKIGRYPLPPALAQGSPSLPCCSAVQLLLRVPSILPGPVSEADQS